MINVFRPHFGTPPPTVESLTRDVHIKPIHSHNDYWRKRPLLDALLYGCNSVEADIWHFDHDFTVKTTTASTARFSHKNVYVGHNQVYLRPENTVEAMYLDPLFGFVDSANKRFSAPLAARTPFGVFYNAPEAPLYFWLDLKTEGRELYDQMRARLERFVERDYLAYYDRATGAHVAGPIVITLTGNVPWEMLEAEKEQSDVNGEIGEIGKTGEIGENGKTGATGESIRYFYGDCPLHQMENATDAQMERFARQCVFASALLAQLIGEDGRTRAARSGQFDPDQSKALARAFARAHQYGLKTRIWGGVEWPVQVRAAHWGELWKLGCDLLNADDLETAATVF